jgi:hypothetical protein
MKLTTWSKAHATKKKDTEPYGDLVLSGAISKLLAFLKLRNSLHGS